MPDDTKPKPAAFTKDDLRRYVDDLESEELKRVFFIVEQECYNPDTLSEEYQLAALLWDTLWGRAEAKQHMLDYWERTGQCQRQ